jgi:hypothetical protein
MVISRICEDLYGTPKKDKMQALQELIRKFEKLSPGLGHTYNTDRSKRDRLVQACIGIQETALALVEPKPTYEGLKAQLRQSIYSSMSIQTHSQNFADRQYQGGNRGNHQCGYQGGYGSRGGYNNRGSENGGLKDMIHMRKGWMLVNKTFKELSDKRVQEFQTYTTCVRLGGR